MVLELNNVDDSLRLLWIFQNNLSCFISNLEMAYVPSEGGLADRSAVPAQHL